MACDRGAVGASAVRVSVEEGTGMLTPLDGESPLLDVLGNRVDVFGSKGRSQEHSGGLGERLMPSDSRSNSNRGILRTAENSNEPKTGVGIAREFTFELLFVKRDKRFYKRPYLHRPGQILEGMLLCAIFLALALSMADSYTSLEIEHPESHCWYHCCKKLAEGHHIRGGCTLDECAAHKDESAKDSPVDNTCAAALFYRGFRDDATWFLMALFTTEFLMRVWSA